MRETRDDASLGSGARKRASGTAANPANGVNGTNGTNGTTGGSTGGRAGHDHAAALPGKTVEESAIEMARMMQPDQANIWGNVHGGTIMRLADEAGGAVAIRHSRRRCVTVAMDSMTFKQPVYIGDLLIIHACLTAVGRTSMEVEARIEAEHLRTGERRNAGTSYLVYVALDDDGHPADVPPLLLRTSEEHARWEAAQERRSRRGR